MSRCDQTTRTHVDELTTQTTAAAFKYTHRCNFPSVFISFIHILFTLSLCFNVHLPGEPGLAGTRMYPFWILLELRVMEVVETTGAIRRAKLQLNRHHQQTNIQFFTGRMSFLSPNQHYRSNEGKLYIIYSKYIYYLLYWTISYFLSCVYVFPVHVYYRAAVSA